MRRISHNNRSSDLAATREGIVLSRLNRRVNASVYGSPWISFRNWRERVRLLDKVIRTSKTRREHPRKHPRMPGTVYLPG